MDLQHHSGQRSSQSPSSSPVYWKPKRKLEHIFNQTNMTVKLDTVGGFIFFFIGFLKGTVLSKVNFF